MSSCHAHSLAVLPAVEREKPQLIASLHDPQSELDGDSDTQPHSEDPSNYHPLRPTRLYKIKSLLAEVRSRPVAKPDHTSSGVPRTREIVSSPGSSAVLQERAFHRCLIQITTAIAHITHIIPFQFGYAVNVISESYIVIPAKAGIHTGWLGRTW